MSRRIEVELTSARDDGSWTWRAAGARQPKGELDGSLLPAGATVGDVLRAEADFDIDGITIVAVLPPKGGRAEPERIEIIGPPPRPRPDPAARPRDDRPERKDRRERRPRGERRADERHARDERPGDDRPRGGRPGDDRPPGGREDRARRPRAERPQRPRPGPLPEPRPKPKRLRPGRAHRDALLAGLEPAEAAVAQQLMRGDLPAVRQAVEQQNVEARAAGEPELPLAPVINLAEQLLPRLRAAEWLDRAEAALAGVEEISVRDLRSVVVSADDVARDERSRDLAATLREALDRRAEAATGEWVGDVTAALDAGRVVRALRLSSRPPAPGTNLPPELAGRLTEAATAALAPDVAPDRWATVLDAVAYSPVRREVKPAGTPSEPGDELLELARKHATRVPAAAQALGVEPPPLRQGRRAGGRRPPAPGKAAPPKATDPRGGPRRPVPPPPPPRPTSPPPPADTPAPPPPPADTPAPPAATPPPPPADTPAPPPPPPRPPADAPAPPPAPPAAAPPADMPAPREGAAADTPAPPPSAPPADTPTAAPPPADTSAPREGAEADHDPADQDAAVQHAAGPDPAGQPAPREQRAAEETPVEPPG